MKSLNGIGVVSVENPIIVEWLEAARKISGMNISLEICENILQSLNGKALSISQVAFKLRIHREMVRRHLFYLWKNGYILRSKYPKEKELVYMVGSSPVTILYYTYTAKNGSAKVPFVTFKEWVNLKMEGKI
jgi:DNA-binding HxlR family transcriptional regulator